jgi:hypothetical protein
MHGGWERNARTRAEKFDEQHKGPRPPWAILQKSDSKGLKEGVRAKNKISKDLKAKIRF